MTRPEAAYAASFLEGSLGLVSRSLKPDEVPRDLVDELAAVMRGAPSQDPSSPSLEARTLKFLEGLEQASLERDGYFVRKARWPGAATWAVCLTHDVDNIDRPPEHIERVKERFSKSDYAAWKKGRLSLYDNIELIGREERARRFRSSFYLMSAEYPLDRVKPEALALHAKGWEIGLHGDFGTHDSQLEMAKAVNRLSKGIGVRPRGLREHYLRFDYEKSWRVMEDSGFDYDTTLGNADTLGFKLGLATPFHPPDAAWRPMRLLELPLSLMDTTLWGYLKESERQGLADVSRLMDMVEGVGGLFTLLWHQEAVRMKGGRIYWRVLDDLRARKRVFVGSGAAIARWWRAREVELRARDGGRLITLGGEPPEGMTLIVKVAKARVTSATVKRGRNGELLVSPRAGFRLEVSGGRA